MSVAEQAADAVPPPLVNATLRAALATGLDAEGVSASLTALAEGVVRPAAWARLKLTLAVLLVVGFHAFPRDYPGGSSVLTSSS